MSLSLLNLDDATGLVQMPSGLLVSDDIARKEIQRMQRPTCLDLFAGCGGFSLGMIAGGFEVVGAVEWDPIAAITYMVNLCRYGRVQIHFVDDEDQDKFVRELEKEQKRGGVPQGITESIAPDLVEAGFKTPTTAGAGWIASHPEHPGVSHFWIGDIRNISGDEILKTFGMKPGELGCICGGPPCQGFSLANKNRGPLDPRNGLVFEFIRLVNEIQPKTMIMENVPQMATMMTPEGTPMIDAIGRMLEVGGFTTYKKFLGAIDQNAGRLGITRQVPKSKQAKPKEAEEIEDDQLSLLEASS